MNILFINKFLYPRGGAETYVLQLAEKLKEMGHKVQFFGMWDEGNTVGNITGQYTENVDFHKKSPKVAKYPFTIVYNKDAKERLREVIADFRPDVAHLNNINFQITPSILETLHDSGIPIVFTAHDFQLLCPNHLLYIPQKNEICEECIDGVSLKCIKENCIHGSKAKSVLGYIEGQLYRKLPNYTYFDRIICPSRFMKSILDRDERFRSKTVFIRNFSNSYEEKETEKGNYILYFGRFYEEKGIRNLVKAMEKLPDIHLIAAGSGPLDHLFEGHSNISNVGFKTGKDLERLVREAKFSVYPSVWYENCPLSIIESQKMGTPCLATGIGGMTELCGKEYVIPGTGYEQLRDAIRDLYDNEEKLEAMRREMEENVKTYPLLEDYAKQAEKIYRELAES